MSSYTLHVYRTTRNRVGRPTFGVYVQLAADGSAQELLEGGFFTRAAANEARDLWAIDLLNNEVEQAERAAGWDPKP